jgi:hypothetical protein
MASRNLRSVLLTMYYALCFGLWHVGPFATAASVQYFTERHGIDHWDLVEVQ